MDNSPTAWQPFCKYTTQRMLDFVRKNAEELRSSSCFIKSESYPLDTPGRQATSTPSFSLTSTAALAFLSRPNAYSNHQNSKHQASDRLHKLSISPFTVQHLRSQLTICDLPYVDLHFAEREPYLCVLILLNPDCA